MAAGKSEKRNCMYLGVCSSYNQDFEADFHIIKSRRPNGIKMILCFGTIMYVNQNGGCETGSSYNFGSGADRNVITNVTAAFSWVAVTMQHRLPSNLIEIFGKFSMAAGFVAAILISTK